MDPRIPIYLITGFLDSGKSTMILDTLSMDYFNDGERTVLLLCEDGEVEFDPDFLGQRNCVSISVEDPSLLTHEFLKEIDQRFQPERVLMEYNGMWPMKVLRDLQLPSNWGLYQAIDMVDGSTFETYSKNNNLMSMALDMITGADIVIFNRCTEDMPLSAWKRTIRAINKMCQVAFEDSMGNEFEVEEILPYSLDSDPIVVEDEDFGIWFVDIQDHPERYEGRSVSLLVQVRNGSKLPKGSFVGCRQAMTCCAEDIRPIGYLIRSNLERKPRSGSWLRLTATVRTEYDPAYDGEGVILYPTEMHPALPPEDEIVYFR